MNNQRLSSSTWGESREIDPIQETLLENTDETHPKFAGDAHRRSDQKNKWTSNFRISFSFIIIVWWVLGLAQEFFDISAMFYYSCMLHM